MQVCKFYFVTKNLVISRQNYIRLLINNVGHEFHTEFKNNIQVETRHIPFDLCIRFNKEKEKKKRERRIIKIILLSFYSDVYVNYFSDTVTYRLIQSKFVEKATGGQAVLITRPPLDFLSFLFPTYALLSGTALLWDNAFSKYVPRDHVGRSQTRRPARGRETIGKRSRVRRTKPVKYKID